MQRMCFVFQMTSEFSVQRETRNTFAISVFTAVWEAIGKLYHKKRTFALRWVMSDEKVLKLFVTNTCDFQVTKLSRSLIYNGYRACKALHPSPFSIDVWEAVDDVFQNYKPYSSLPKPLRIQMNNLHLNQRELLDMVCVREKMNMYTTVIAQNAVVVAKLEPAIWEPCVGAVLGCWDSLVLLEDERKKFRFLKIPSQFFFVRKGSNLNYFYDSSGEEPVLVAMVMHQQILDDPALGSIRSLLANHHSAHKSVIRGVGKRSFDSYMTGNGPFHNWRVDNERVCFYTHESKLQKIIGDEEFAIEFGKLLDKHAHGNLVEIILGLYLWWCPELLKSFLQYSAPFFKGVQSSKSILERSLDLGGPTAYQLFITADYCAEIHRDADVTDFTLCYASHPDSHISPIDFVLAEYGMRLPIENGNLFAFRSNLMHGTSYRIPTSNVAYVGALTVNQKLNKLVHKH